MAEGWFRDSFYLIWCVFIIFVYAIEFTNKKHKLLDVDNVYGWGNRMIAGAMLFHLVAGVIGAIGELL